tara:strand:- start:3095 stop:3775 length:681 start_codon:yes stop_codon:yes gene_type:complete
MSESTFTDSYSETSDSASEVSEGDVVETSNDKVEIPNSNICCICLDEVSADTSYKLEQCGHLFHTNCIVRNIQQGNISCPCCRKLPLFVSNVCDSYDLREDLIDEYNEEQKRKIFKKATRLVTTGDSSKGLTRVVMSYKKVYDKIQLLKQKNKEIKKTYSEMNKETRALECEEEKEYRDVRKKYNIKRKEIKKRFKCRKMYRINNRSLNEAFENVIKYMGYRPVEY